MSMTEVLFDITVDATGDSVDTSTREVFGWLEKFVYAKDDFANGVDLVLSMQDTPSGVAETIVTYTNINASTVNYPVVDRVDTAGSAETGQPTRHFLVGKPRIVTDEGGVSTSGKVILYIENAE